MQSLIFPGWQQISTQLTLHTPTRTNLPAIYRLSVKQKNSKNKRVNFLPQTTIRLVSGSQTERATVEQKKRWKSAISRSPQLLPLALAASPIIFQHAETSQGQFDDVNDWLHVCCTTYST